MDTILNLGLNMEMCGRNGKKRTAAGLGLLPASCQMYSDVVLGADASMFTFVMEDLKSKKNILVMHS